MDRPNMCLPKNGRSTNIPKRNCGRRKGELFGHRKIKQKGKLETIGLLPHEASKR